MVKAVLFDLDGTLTNTLQDIANAMNRSLRINGLPEFETDAYRYLVGNGAKILAQRAVRDQQALVAKVQQDYQAYYETHNQVTTRPYDGIPEMLHALYAMGLKLCVLSNKPHADTQHVVAHYFPDVAFSVVRGQMEGVPIKPDPAGALAIAEAIGVDPADFLYLGDTSVDMTCARNAGMHPVGVKWGFRDETELREAGAEYIIDTPMQAVDIAKKA
jgi:phosphoglycolate phosphatase